LDKHIIFGIHITNRFTHVPEAQSLFTEYGCNIKTRLGLHEVENKCSPNGLVLLEMYGDEARCHELAAKLAAIEGLEVQKMVFTHD
jgi:hypothetical protein